MSKGMDDKIDQQCGFAGIPLRPANIGLPIGPRLSAWQLCLIDGNRRIGEPYTAASR